MTDSGSSWDQQTVDPKIFLKLSKDITKNDLTAVSEHLGVPDGTLAAITADNEGRHDLIVYNVLKKWSQMRASEATNGVLRNSLVSAERGDLATKLREGKYSDGTGFGGSTNVSSRNVLPKFKSDIPTTPTTSTTFNVPHYTMKTKPLGKCVILTYSFKGDKDLERLGNSVDEKNLKEVFGKKVLGFDVEHHPDLDFQKTKDVIKEMSEKHHWDGFVLFVSSHGDAESFLTSDKKSITIQEVLTQFNVNNCDSLAGKPKIFFFNTCRGDASQEMVNRKLMKDGGTPSLGVGAMTSYYRPNEADFCVVLSTVPGYASLRNEETGSFFVENLCKCLKDNYTKLHLIDILTINNDIMINKAETDERFSGKGESKTCQVTTTITSLSKAVYFVDKDK